jgi:uncharacterized membrane protein
MYVACLWKMFSRKQLISIEKREFCYCDLNFSPILIKIRHMHTPSILKKFNCRYYLSYKIGNIRFVMKYIFIIYLFGVININIFTYISGQTNFEYFNWQCI